MLVQKLSIRALFLFAACLNAPQLIAQPVIDQALIHKAYTAQKHLIASQAENGSYIVGYKAGVMSESSYRKFALQEPVTGIFFQGSQLRADSGSYVATLASAKRLMLELEFAFVLSKAIEKPIERSDLTTVIGSFAPSVELPDFYFAQKPTGDLIISTNVLSHQFIVGRWQKFTHESVAEIDRSEVELFCEQTLETNGKGNNALSSQADALTWMINHLLSSGFQLKEGHILLTGNLAKMVPAKPCKYRASFKGFDDIAFEVVP